MEQELTRADAVNIAKMKCHHYFDSYFELVNLKLKRRRSKREAEGKVEKILENRYIRAKEDDREVKRIIAEMEEEYGKGCVRQS